jgi:hypothetical protein
MLATEEFIGVIEGVLARVDPVGQPVADHDQMCSRDHREIARKGVEEGLKLALRLLREQTGKEGSDPN